MNGEGAQTDRRTTITATVGIGHTETTEVPEQVGQFDHREVPNDDTTEWERVHQPREPGDYPYVAVRYAVSCAGIGPEADGEFHVSRSVIACSRRSGVPNFPHANGSGPVHSETVVSSRTVARGFAGIEDALPFAERLMEADSTSRTLPPELTDSQRKGFRQWQMGEVDGQ